MSRSAKAFQEYIAEPTAAHVGYENYARSPASAFLKYTVEAKSAINLCQRRFPQTSAGDLTKNSLDSIQHLTAAMLPAIMGHFETYQRFLFAGMFDASGYLKAFKVDSLLKRLEKDCALSIDPVRLAAHRGLGAKSIGLVLADSLAGWQSPTRVNVIFSAFELGNQFFSADNSKTLEVLWQMRHAIVHTGGTLTLADAQKVAALSEHGDKKLVFENQFIYEVSRKLHPLVKLATERMGTTFKGKLYASTPNLTRVTIDELFEVKSTVAVWLR